MRKKKILWYSDSPLTPSGFGHVAREILARLAATNLYEIYVMGIGHVYPWYDRDKYPYIIYSTGENDLSNSRNFLSALYNEDWDAVFMFNDFQVINAYKEDLLKVRSRKRLPLITYVPIDWEIPDGSEFEPFTYSDYPVVYTNWAKNQVLSVLPQLKKKLNVIYHGANTEIYRPIDREERNEFRKKTFGVDDDTFLVVNVNSNQWRKDLPRTMLGYRLFREQNPKIKTRLYLHTQVRPTGSRIDLLKQAQQCGLESGTFITPDQKYNALRVSDEQMNLIYNAADVVVSTSLGEGWGLSMTEAMAAHIPVMMPNNTVFPEVMGNGSRGSLVERSDIWTVCSPEDNHIRPITDIYDFSDKLLEVYNGGDLITERISNASKFVEDKLNWDVIGEEWIKLFKRATR